MNVVLAAAQHASHTARRLAELGFLLFLFAGFWFVLAEFREFGRAKGIVAGAALALGAVLLILAVRRAGNFH